MKVLCVFGEHNYGDPERGAGYEYSNFIPALEQLGHEVVFFESLNKSCYRDFEDMNRQLLQMVESEKPDIIFCVLMTYEIWMETLQCIRDGSHAALIHWAADDSWKYEQFSRLIAPLFDLYATTYPSALKKSEADGLDNFRLSQWAADSTRMLPPLKSDECRYQVSFIGSNYGNRPEWVQALKDRGIHVDTFGYGWPSGPVAAENISEIMRASKVSLNFGDSGMVLKAGEVKHSRQIKARVFEVAGAGGLLVTEPAEHLEEFFELGKELVVFENIDELALHIRDLLAHPEKRDAIALAGFERTKNEHTYESRFTSIIESALVYRQSRARLSHGIDFDAFDCLARSYQPHLLLYFLKYILLLPCLLIWGRQRGPRAARRLLYEFSWRYMGEKTYSVSSWVGRLFYKES